MNVNVEQEWKEEMHFGLSSLVRRGSRRSQARIKNNYLKPSNHFWPMRLAPNHPYSANKFYGCTYIWKIRIGRRDDEDAFGVG